MKSKTGDILLLLSPLIITFFLRLTATLLNRHPGSWVWVPFVLIYWLTLTVTVKLAPLSFTLKEIFRKSSGRWYWSVIVVILGLGGISYLFENAAYYRIPQYVCAGVVFSLINPVFEEVYWRKMFIDSYPQRKYVIVLYSTTLFALMHYVTLGVISAPNQEPIILPITFAAGLLWSVVYIKTKTLRYVILSHMLMDVFGFSALFIR
jgi:hypothetical protein